MRIHSFSDLEGVRIAIEMERRGGEHYRRAARVVKEPAIAALLERLYADELEHIRAFNALYQTVKADRPEGDVAYDAEVSALLSAIASDIVFPDGVMPLVGTDNLADILAYGIRSEEDSIRFYEKMVENARDAKTRAVFSTIIEQEQDHLDDLSALFKLAETVEAEHLGAYQSWLTEFAADPETYAELRAIASDPDEIKDRFYTHLQFGTAGMRGVIGAGLNRMNVHNVRRATCALAQYIAGQPGRAEMGVAIAFDSRRFSERFAREAALVLSAGGVRAMLFDALCPVPVLSFAVRHLKATAGIVITASHNPKKYNGYKVYWEDGGQMPPERADAIQRLINETTYAQARPMDEGAARAAGLLQTIGPEVDDAYLQSVLGLMIDPDRARREGGSVRIVYTPLHGSGARPVMRALSEAGFSDVRMVPEQAQPDPDFSTVDTPNPEDPAALRMALALGEAVGADLVMGTDPDCDRMGVAVRRADGTTRAFTGNEIGCLLLNFILEGRRAAGTLPKNAAAVKSIVTTEMARAICDAYGVALIDVLTGFKFIAEKMQAFEETGSHTFIFGFEESCGYLSGTDVRDKDGVNACLLMAEAALYYKARGMTLLDALNALFDAYGHYGARVVSFDLSGADGLARSAALMAALRGAPPARFGDYAIIAARDYMSGLRTAADGAQSPLDQPRSDVLYYELTDGAWVCVRPSGTEPKIKLYLNARTQSADATRAALDALGASVMGYMDALTGA